MDERPQTDAVRLANSQEFCQAVLDDIEFVFRQRYGKKWTPTAQAFLEQLRRTCLEAARQVDEGIEPAAILPLREAVMLTMGTRRGS